MLSFIRCCIQCCNLCLGPKVQGCRPVLVTFESFRDREDVLKNSKVLRKTQITVTEDLSKRTRESRQELRKFMRTIKKTNPERRCFLEYDRLYVDQKIYVWNDIAGQVTTLNQCDFWLIEFTQVVEQSECEKLVDPMSRMPSAFSRAGRPGLTKGYSVSSPNVAAVGGDQDILERIRDLELQIVDQQVAIQSVVENTNIEI